MWGYYSVSANQSLNNEITFLPAAFRKSKWLYTFRVNLFDSFILKGEQRNRPGLFLFLSSWPDCSQSSGTLRERACNGGGERVWCLLSQTWRATKTRRKLLDQDQYRAVVYSSTVVQQGRCFWSRIFSQKSFLCKSFIFNPPVLSPVLSNFKI